MAARFVGGGIQEFQEQAEAAVPFTPAELPDWLVDIGIAPIWEALALQVAVLAVDVFLALSRRRLPASAAAN